MSAAPNGSDDPELTRVLAGVLVGLAFGFIGGTVNTLITDVVADTAVRAAFRMSLICAAVVVGAIAAGTAFRSRNQAAIAIGSVVAAAGLMVGFLALSQEGTSRTRVGRRDQGLRKAHFEPNDHARDGSSAL